MSLEDIPVEVHCDVVGPFLSLGDLDALSRCSRWLQNVFGPELARRKDIALRALLPLPLGGIIEERLNRDLCFMSTLEVWKHVFCEAECLVCDGTGESEVVTDLGTFSRAFLEATHARRVRDPEDVYPSGPLWEVNDDDLYFESVKLQVCNLPKPLDLFFANMLVRMRTAAGDGDLLTFRRLAQIYLFHWMPSCLPPFADVATAVAKVIIIALLDGATRGGGNGSHVSSAAQARVWDTLQDLAEDRFLIGNSFIGAVSLIGVSLQSQPNEKDNDDGGGCNCRETIKKPLLCPTQILNLCLVYECFETASLVYTAWVCPSLADAMDSDWSRFWKMIALAEEHRRPEEVQYFFLFPSRIGGQPARYFYAKEHAQKIFERVPGLAAKRLHTARVQLLESNLAIRRQRICHWATKVGLFDAAVAANPTWNSDGIYTKVAYAMGDGTTETGATETSESAPSRHNM